MSASRPASLLTILDRAPSPLDKEIDVVVKYGEDDGEPEGRFPDKTVLSEDADPTFVSWDGPDDPENPQNWSIRRKWLITLVCCALAINVTFASSAPTSAGERLAERFGIDDEIVDLVTTLFLVGYVFGPFIWGPGSEILGRRIIFMVAMTSYTLLSLGQALAPNIQTLLVTRFFSGFFAVAPLVTCGGTIADIWSTEGRGKASSLFGGSVFLGPSLGPLIGGFVADSTLEWNWVFWIIMIFAGSCTFFMFVCLPETYAPVILARKAKRLRKEDPITCKNLRAEHEDQDWSMLGLVRHTIFRPFKMLAMEPILVLVTLYMSVVYGVLYALFEAFPIIFIETRGFSITQNGLIFIGVGIGSVAAALVNLLLCRPYVQLTVKWKGSPPPEPRLYGAMIGGVSLVIGSFWIGWTGNYPGVPWYVPAMSTPFIGAAIALIFVSFVAYLVDTYMVYSASALAANTVIRSIVGAVFPLFTAQMYHNLGINWASTLIGLISLVLAPIPFLFYKYGAKIRAHSKFAPCKDLRIAKELEALHP